jgi:hypothetical protein
LQCHCDVVYALIERAHHSPEGTAHGIRDVLLLLNVLFRRLQQVAIRAHTVRLAALHEARSCAMNGLVRKVHEKRLFGRMCSYNGAGLGGEKVG